VNRQLKIIISGGGTGGHIFPAISIANALRTKVPGVDILFVGATGKMEMEKVPQAGYPIMGLPVTGFQRRLSFKNITFFFNLFSSLIKAKKIVKNFKPDVVVGVGGYASGPVLRVASKMNIPVLIQEQNSYAGVTNKILASRASKICVAYEGMEKFFPMEKIIITGNPVRQDLNHTQGKKQEALSYFDFSENRKIILIIGGSLGAGSINQCMASELKRIRESKAYFIWQTGKTGFNPAKESLGNTPAPNLRLMEFITRMDLAYSSADLVISRAGAGTISELCLTGKPSILVPSPNVAENHQEKNAMTLVKHEAAVMIKDSEVMEKLLDSALGLVGDENRLKTLSANILKLAKPDSDQLIADEILKLVK
jgi:UDP-N-acetylglucosamine--N-acetylmuramyl-(pentapeptide) pyrophosphoryl-undecaprenol N-acetylglucosamine transferase